MENAIEKTCVAERKFYLPEFLVLLRQSAAIMALFKKIRVWLLSVIDFIACPSFFEGEIANTSGFNTRILLINKLNNK